MPSGWIGVDLDGTLAKYDDWRGIEHIGAPVPKMLKRVKKWIKEGKTVKIFTARANNGDEAIQVIDAWCEKHIGQKLEVTATKDFAMISLWDDRCIQVIPNKGVRVDGSL